MQPIKVISMSSLQAEMLVEQKVANSKKSTVVAYLLWFFLGGFGGHRFYLGKTGTAIVQLVITIIGCFTLFPLIISGIWLLIDAFLIPSIVREHTEEVRYRARREVALIQQG
jgi:TM2 domain-containing membrane protein YozV